MLAGWAREAATPEEYLEAAEASARLWPESAAAHSYLGEARLRNASRDRAKESFRRVLTLGPAHGFAAMTLFDVEMEDREFNAAGATLEVLKQHAEPGDAYVISREVQWHAARADRAAAGEALGRLCRARAVESDWPWRAADRAFVQAGWHALAESTYARALDHPDAAPLVAPLWVERWTGHKAWRRSRRLKALLAAGGEPAHQAPAAYVKALAEARQGWRLTVLHAPLPPGDSAAIRCAGGWSATR